MYMTDCSNKDDHRDVHDIVQCDSHDIVIKTSPRAGRPCAVSLLRGLPQRCKARALPLQRAAAAAAATFIQMKACGAVVVYRLPNPNN